MRRRRSRLQVAIALVSLAAAAAGAQPSGKLGRVAGKATCYTLPAPGTGGLEDLYYYTSTSGPLPMTPAFTPANASRWTINF